ncbi:hypothetical protein [Nocardia terpenica]|uniref:Lipoprotein n=1 Tax=Nocardia terpenica TaxID=455432 RepID=A0A6G9ZBP7_9NOCA|nr:hypothetical protein [Nocardia terpenica]QIS22821.1 hypothetical protein F6W96_35275 [Nocardia terpenica]
MKQRNIVRRTMIRSAYGGLTVALLAGCSRVTTGPIPAHGTGLSGPAGVAASPEQQAVDQATALLRNYYAVLTRLVRDDGADLKALRTVSSGDQVDRARREVAKLRTGEGIDPTLIGSRPTRHTVPKDPDTGAPAPGHATIDFDTCVGADRDRSASVITTLDDPDWPDPAGWRVTRTVALPDQRCTTSLF